MITKNSIYNCVDLSSIADISIGKTPSRSNSIYWGSGKNWLSIADMKGDFEVRETKEQITELAIKETGIKVVPKGSILFSFKLSIGKVAIAGDDLYTNEAIAAFNIRDTNKVDAKYLYYVLREFDFSGSGDKAVMGLTLNQKKLRVLQIPLPPLETQKKIAAILDKADELRQNDKKILEKYDQLAQSIFLEMFGDTYLNPRNWDLFKIKDLAAPGKNSIKAGPFGSSLKKEYYVSSGYKIYGQEQVIRDDLSYGDYYIGKDLYRKLESCKIKDGDLLISLVGSYGLISIVPPVFEAGIINPRLMKITVNQDIIHPVFLKYLLHSKGIKTKIENSTHGGTMDIVNVGIMKEIQVPVPPLASQGVFLEILDNIDKQKTLTQQCLQKSEDLFQSLLQRAFMGEL
jgi:type I restriction enzyme S subunit